MSSDSGRYELNKCLFFGQGAYGSICGATYYHKDGRKIECCAKVILKIKLLKVLEKYRIDNKLIQREKVILEELSKLENMNLVKIYQIDEKEKELIIIMELCKGDLENLMKKRVFNQQECLHLIKQFLKGYKTLHDKQIIHRDIKPSNILVQDDQNLLIKITDFGMGRILEDAKKQLEQTRVGSPIYAAPQIFLDTMYSSKADLYSLGVICYRLLFNEFHIKADTENQLISKLLLMKNDPIKCPSTSDVHPQVKNLIERMLQFYEDSRISWEELFTHQIFTSEQPNQYFPTIVQTAIQETQKPNAPKLTYALHYYFKRIIQVLPRNQTLPNPYYNKEQQTKQIIEINQNTQLVETVIDKNLKGPQTQSICNKQHEDFEITQQIQNKVQTLQIETTDNQKINLLIQALIVKGDLANSVRQYFNDLLPALQISELDLLSIQMSLIGYKYTTLLNSAGLANNQTTYISKEMKTKLDFEKLQPSIQNYINDQSAENLNIQDYIKKQYYLYDQEFQVNNQNHQPHQQDCSKMLYQVFKDFFYRGYQNLMGYYKFLQLLQQPSDGEYGIYLSYFEHFYKTILLPKWNQNKTLCKDLTFLKLIYGCERLLALDRDFPITEYQKINISQICMNNNANELQMKQYIEKNRQ